MINFDKIDKTCSNVYLIDETLCLSNTLEVINYNTASLSSAILNLKAYEKTWANLYSLFTVYSAQWIKTATNIQTFSAKWINTASTVNALSATWTKEYTLYYPKMLDVGYWNSLGSTNQNNTIISWLNLNFPASKVNSNQVISVVVYLNQIYNFSFNFNRSYYETCIPNGGGLSIGCGGCPKPFQGCNHHGGKAGVGPCTNLFDACSVQSHASAPAPVSCVGGGGRFLNIGLNRAASEKNVASVIRLKFAVNGNNWVITS